MSQSLFRSDRPIVARRVVHLDLKGLPPTFDRLMRLLRVFAAARFNGILVEWEDMFPWTIDRRFRSPEAYTEEQVERFCREARSLGFDLIPLVQCLGHMETPLHLPDYAHLREVPYRVETLNALADGANELVRAMVSDVLRLMPGVTYFHLGGDEADTFGQHPETQKFIAQHGRGALYLKHIKPLIKHLRERGIRPMLWHDMMKDWDDAVLRRLSPQSDLVVWGYNEHPDQTQLHYNSKHIVRYRANGLTLWGATAYKGADGADLDLPVLEHRQANGQAWCDIALRERMEGVISTAWSRCGTQWFQFQPIDSALDAAMLHGVILHDGQAPVGGIEACVEALEPLGERETLERCKRAMERLRNARGAGWAAVRELRQQIVTQRLDARRHPGMAVHQFIRLQRAVNEMSAAVQVVQAQFDGLVMSRSLEHYLAERLTPLQEELQAAAPEVHMLDPEGFQQRVSRRSSSCARADC